MQTLISNCSDEFFCLIGHYTQLCSHIEGVAWRILIAHEAPDTLSINDGLIDIRKSHAKLKKKLRSASKQMKEPISDNLESVLNRIEDEIDYRHLAVHGMWFPTEKPGVFKVEYYKKVKKSENDKDGVWMQYNEEVSLDQIRNVIVGANEILLELLKIFEDLRNSNKGAEK